MRALILGLSVLAIVASANLAKAGLTTTPREQPASVDTVSASEETNEEAEDKLGLTYAKRRAIQRGLTKLGFETKADGRFDESTRGAITRWQDEHGYPKTGFLNADQTTALLDDSTAVSKTDHENRRSGGRSHHSRGIGGPIGAIGHMVGGLFRR